MRTRLLWTVLSLVLSVPALSQRFIISGAVEDSVVHRSLAFATITLMRAADSSLVTFARGDSAGRFRLRPVPPGAYVIRVTYAGYARSEKRLNVGGASSASLGTMYLARLHPLADITINGERPAVVVNNDTLEFNTEHFITPPNSVVEDLLKKLPGVTIDPDGTVRVNGQVIQSILVNGKPFFANDIKLATKNLPADAVDKVQVFDRATDQAAFTGIDDGNSTKAINLVLKKDRNHMRFGSVSAGAGGDASSGASNQLRFDAQANVNQFSGEQQLSFLGMANNINRQGFTLTDVLNFTGQLSNNVHNGGGSIQVGSPQDNPLPITGLGQNQQGIAQTLAGGLNYNDDWASSKTQVNASFIGTGVDLNTDRLSATQNLVPGSTYTGLDTNGTEQREDEQRLGMRIEQSIDSFTSVIFTPVLTFQQSMKNSLDQTQSFRPGSSDTLLNAGVARASDAATATDFNGTALIRRKFRRAGRTLSLNLTYLSNVSRENGNQSSSTLFYAGANPPVDSLVNLQYQRNGTVHSEGANVTYTEPVGRHSLFGLNGYVTNTVGDAGKNSFNFDGNNGKYDIFDSALSNTFSSRYVYYGGGPLYRTIQGKLNLSLGLSLQQASLVTAGSGPSIPGRHFTDLLPNFLLTYQFRQTENLRVQYSTYTVQPSVAQLQPVADLSNPLDIEIGNPGLLRQYTHDLVVSFNRVRFGAGRMSGVLLDFQDNPNSIVTSDRVNQDGGRVSSYANAGGVYSLHGGLINMFPLLHRQASIQPSLMGNYSRNVSFINGQRNGMTNATLGPDIRFSYDKDSLVTFWADAGLTFNTASYALEPSLNDRYFQQTYSFNSTWFLPSAFRLGATFTYTVNTGRTAGYNTAIPLWNASVERSFLKYRKADIRLEVDDLLNKNTGITRNTTTESIVDQRYNVLQRYVLLTLTYHLNRPSGGGKGIQVHTFRFR